MDYLLGARRSTAPITGRLYRKRLLICLAKISVYHFGKGQLVRPANRYAPFVVAGSNFGTGGAFFPSINPILPDRVGNPASRRPMFVPTEVRGGSSIELPQLFF